MACEPSEQSARATPDPLEITGCHEEPEAATTAAATTRGPWHACLQGSQQIVVAVAALAATAAAVVVVVFVVVPGLLLTPRLLLARSLTLPALRRRLPESDEDSGNAGNTPPTNCSPREPVLGLVSRSRGVKSRGSHRALEASQPTATERQLNK